MSLDRIILLILFFGGLLYVWYSIITKRGLGSWLKQRQAHREMEIIEQLGLAPRTSLLLVKVRGQSFLVIQSPQNAQMLSLGNSSEKTPVSEPAPQS